MLQCRIAKRRQDMYYPVLSIYILALHILWYVVPWMTLTRFLGVHYAQYTPPTRRRRDETVELRRRRRCVHEFAASSRRLPTDSVM